MITTSDLYNKVLTADTILSYGDKANLLTDAEVLGWYPDRIALDRGVLVLTNNKGLFIWCSRYNWICAELTTTETLVKVFQNHRYYKNIYDAFQTENNK